MDRCEFKQEECGVIWYNGIEWLQKIGDSYIGRCVVCFCVQGSHFKSVKIKAKNVKGKLYCECLNVPFILYSHILIACYRCCIHVW